MQESKNLFESRLEQEVLRSEKLQATMIAGLFAVSAMSPAFAPMCMLIAVL